MQVAYQPASHTVPVFRCWERTAVSRSPGGRGPPAPARSVFILGQVNCTLVPKLRLHRPFHMYMREGERNVFPRRVRGAIGDGNRKGNRKMHMMIEAGVTVGVAEDGVLCLVSCDGAPHFYSPAATGMWIALRRSGGNLESAAAALQSAWGVDSAEIRLLIEEQVGSWERDRLVRTLSCAPRIRRSGGCIPAQRTIN